MVRIHHPQQGTQVQTLVGELRSSVPQGQLSPRATTRKACAPQWRPSTAKTVYKGQGGWTGKTQNMPNRSSEQETWKNGGKTTRIFIFIFIFIFMFIIYIYIYIFLKKEWIGLASSNPCWNLDLLLIGGLTPSSYDESTDLLLWSPCSFH